MEADYFYPWEPASCVPVLSTKSKNFGALRNFQNEATSNLGKSDIISEFQKSGDVRGVYVTFQRSSQKVRASKGDLVSNRLSKINLTFKSIWQSIAAKFKTILYLAYVKYCLKRKISTKFRIINSTEPYVNSQAKLVKRQLFAIHLLKMLGHKKPIINVDECTFSYTTSSCRSWDNGDKKPGRTFKTRIGNLHFFLAVFSDGWHCFTFFTGNNNTMTVCILSKFCAPI